MLARIRSKLTFANVASSLALFIAVSTGGAYAANTIGSSDIIDESILSADIKNGTIATSDLALNSVGSGRVVDESLVSADIKNGTITAGDLAPNVIGSGKVVDESLLSADIKNGEVGTADLAAASVDNSKLANNSVTSDKVVDDTVAGGGLNSEDINPLNGDTDIQDNTITTFDIATDAIDSDEVLDFGLTNADVAVLGVDVNADATIAQDNALGVTTGLSLGTGSSEIDFGRNISSCTMTATIGPPGGGSAQGLIDLADRSGNPEAVFVRTYTQAGVLSSQPFRLVVVC